MPETPDKRPGKRPAQELTTVERFNLCAEWARATERGQKEHLLRAWRVTRQTACRLFRCYETQLASGNPVHLSRAKRGGRPPMVTEKRWEDAKAALAPHERYNWRMWSDACGIPLASLFRVAKGKGTKFILVSSNLS